MKVLYTGVAKLGIWRDKTFIKYGRDTDCRVWKYKMLIECYASSPKKAPRWVLIARRLSGICLWNQFDCDSCCRMLCVSFGSRGHIHQSCHMYLVYIVPLVYSTGILESMEPNGTYNISPYGKRSHWLMPGNLLAAEIGEELLKSKYAQHSISILYVHTPQSVSIPYLMTVFKRHIPNYTTPLI